mgnify:CR=1 FL=1
MYKHIFCKNSFGEKINASSRLQIYLLLRTTMRYNHRFIIPFPSLALDDDEDATCPERGAGCCKTYKKEDRRHLVCSSFVC